MTKEYLAHSERDGYPPQTYRDHVKGVSRRALKYAAEAGQYAAEGQEILVSAVQKSAELHDLGKLGDENQDALHDDSGKTRHLPVNHVDAGSAVLKNINAFSALAVYAHHRGLPNMEMEELRNGAMFRDEHPATRKLVDDAMPMLLARHRMAFPPSLIYQVKYKWGMLLARHCAAFPQKSTTPTREYEGNPSVFGRMVLSCLADADHTDTATAYGRTPKTEKIPQLRAKERLAALDRYVSQLGGEGERSQLRHEMYMACSNVEISESFSACDSPVGSGKTTAVMAHLLKQAIKRESRHVFVVLPYTSIIQQSVDVYRKALLLPGERPDEVVAELHFRADFEDDDTRYLTSLWRAPIIVTTAVAFFETLASGHPATLRRFHELPGSVIFVDEAHNALPLKLLPLAWHWMNVLAEEWSCYWVLASGSLVRYWELEHLSKMDMPNTEVCELIAPDLHHRLMEYEKNRIAFRYRSDTVSREELAAWVHNSPGPRLVILNTVQSAAVIASDLRDRYGREQVEHLSTALTPEDREIVIKRVKQRLDDCGDTDWTLVATSCVEAGVDFSFRTGFREMASLLSLLQAAGRVGRNGEYPEAEMWSFVLQEDSMLKQNSQLISSIDVLKGYFQKNVKITPELSTKAMNDEIIRDDSCLREIKKLLEFEAAMEFQAIDEKFRVIDSDTVPAVVDPVLVTAISFGKGDWKLLQRKAVSVRRDQMKNWNLKEIATGVYQWTLRYDDFLGYMAGVIDLCKLKNGVLMA